MWLEALGPDLQLLALFGIQRSVMARRGFKRSWTSVVPPAVERRTYVVATGVVLALLFEFWMPIEGTCRVAGRTGCGCRSAVESVRLGWVLVWVSGSLLNPFEFFGLQQVFACLTQRAIPRGLVQDAAAVPVCAPPLYVGFLMGLWSVPRMTAGRQLFAVGLCVYILIGIGFEERNLLQLFGERYRAHREQVGC